MKEVGSNMKHGAGGSGGIEGLSGGGVLDGVAIFRFLGELYSTK